MPIPESQRVSFPLGWEVVVEASEPPTPDMSKPLVHNIMYYRPEEIDAEAFVVSVMHVCLFNSYLRLLNISHTGKRMQTLM